MAGAITALKLQKKNQDRVSLFIDGRFAFGLPAIVAARLKIGEVLSDADIEALRNEGDVETAYSRTLDYLSYRPRSRAEIAVYLQKRDVSEGSIEEICGRLERAGLVDDEAFARFWVENREQHRPRGPRALRHELRQKGVSNEVIERALADVDVRAGAYQAAERKAHQLRHEDEPIFRRKLLAYLARRGFDYDVAREVVDHYWNLLSVV